MCNPNMLTATKSSLNDSCKLVWRLLTLLGLGSSGKLVSSGGGIFHPLWFIPLTVNLGG